MSWEFTEITRDDHVAIVRFEKDATRNAFDAALIRELTAVARSFHEDHDIHAVVLTGSDKAFSSGADLTEVPSETTLAEKRTRSLLGRELCNAWEGMPQITVAAMEKYAVGGGIALGLACDWRVMGRDAFIYVPEVNIGVTLQWQTIPRLVTLVGPARAKQIVILCERMGADQALAWGLIDAIADDGSTVEEACKLARRAAAMPPEIAAISKQSINATANALMHATAHMDADLSLFLLGAEPHQQARADFAKGNRRS